MLMDIAPALLNGSPTNITALGNGTALFQANDAIHGKELWVTDGTAAHTPQMDINSGGSGSFPSGFTSLGNGRCCFRPLI
jgi:ELWxxDGT repeat protein